MFRWPFVFHGFVFTDLDDVVTMKAVDSPLCVTSAPLSAGDRPDSMACTFLRCQSWVLTRNHPRNCVGKNPYTVVLFPRPDSALNKRATNCGRSLGLRLCSNHKTSFSYSVLSRLNCPRLECGSCSLWLPLRVRQCTASRQDQYALTLVS